MKPGTNQPERESRVAIVGMACMFPGAPDLETYWSNILSKVSAIGEPPPGWGADRYYDPEDVSGERVYTTSGGFLGDIARFNPAEFGIMPSSVDGGEPDQMLALKVAVEALRDAGYHGSAVDHTNTGIILGHSTYLHRGNAGVVQHGVVLDQTIELLAQLHPELNAEQLAEFRRALKAKLPPFNVDTAPGLVPNVMTGRIANRLDFRGPNYLIDAACASSLLAVGAAMEELVHGRADLMLAGGVNASIPAEVDMVFCQLGALSRSSRIRPFDKEANGTLLGEGLGMVVLKRVADALRDGDRIYAVLRAVGNSSDGRGLGLLAPRLEGETLAIARAYAQAGVDPAQVGLIEAHGTGIPLGDRTEIAALKSIKPRGRGLPDCALGSVKSMISHCIPAAGAASLIKTALALHHRILPPTLCDEVNPELGIDQTNLYVNTEARPWIHGGDAPRRAGVNAFGFGGINTHAVLEEAPADGALPSRWRPREAELFLLDGVDRNDLLEKLGRLRRFIAGGGDYRWSDLALALSRRLAGGHHRLAVVARDRDDLARKLDQLAVQLADTKRRQLQSRSGAFFSDRPLDGRLAFMFPGEGSQYPGMLADLACEFPTVRRWFDFWDALYRDTREILPSQVVFPPPTGLDDEGRRDLERRLFGMDVGSEAVFIASRALFDLLGEFGIDADAMVGHSTGENTALTAAGVADYADRGDLARHIVRLNGVYRELDAKGVIPTGRLLTVGAVARERLTQVVEAAAGRLHLAMDNCNHQSVLFGDPASIDEVAGVLKAEGALCSVLPFDRAYHTPLFEPVGAAFEAFYRGIPVKPPRVPLYSCASSAPFPKGAAAIRRLAASQWASPVRFRETVERMYDDGVRLFLEVGPGGNLGSFVRDILKDRPHLALQANDRSRGGMVHWLGLLGQLFVQGRPVDLAPLFAGRPTRALDVDAPPPAAKKAPLLVNTLPYVRIDDEEAARLRAHLTPPQPSMPAAAAPVVARPAREAVMNGHLALMNGFLANQEAVMATRLALPRAKTQRRMPFVQRVVSRSGDAVAVECRLDVAHDRFLRHHILSGPVSAFDRGLHGLAVVPLTVSLEMLAETASLLAERPVVSSLRNVRAFNWIALDEGRLTLRIEAARTASAADGVYACVTVDGVRMLEATVVFGEPMPAAPALPAPAARGNSRWRDEELYTTGMFHGPLFQTVRHIHGWDEGAIEAELTGGDTDGFFRRGARPAFLFNPVLLDAVGQLTAFWISEQIGTDFNSFPSSIERIDFHAAPVPEVHRLRGQLAYLPQDGGAARFLEGRFECTDGAGRPVFTVSGWRDRFFTVPHRFYRTRSRPLDGWLTEDVRPQFGRACGTLRFLEPFPSGFLEDAGAIWKRVLAHLALSRREREQWRALPANPRVRTSWLLGRIAVKEAVRQWYSERHGLQLYPADVEIDNAPSGRPFVRPERLAAYGPVPAISLAHAEGGALATAADAIAGVDLEPEGRSSADILAAGALTEAERAWLQGRSAAERDIDALSLWCAKEAAAKALGTGLNGRPHAFTVEPDAAGSAVVTHDGHRVPVCWRRHRGWVLAAAES